MYHRFNENKYPSTNIRMNVFDEQMQIIKNLGYKFYDPKFFEEEFSIIKKESEIKYENIPDLCKKYKIKKNLINPDYSG